MALRMWLMGLREKLPELPFCKETITVVMGNEACDLDSGVSAICLSYHLSQLSHPRLVLPLLNITAQDFTLKTELVATLAKEGIAQTDLLFRDTLDLVSLKSRLQLVLVDHNVLAQDDIGLTPCVVDILDHHVRESNLEEATIEPVGSCATLVLRKIVFEQPTFSEPSCLRMLLTTILLDTVCLEEAAKRVTPEDVLAVERIEKVLGPQDRRDIFNKVLEEKARTDHLSVGQLLRRDLKVVLGTDGLSVALSSVPMLATTFCQLEEAVEQMDKFLADNKYQAVLVIGIKINDGVVVRDLLLKGNRETVDKMKEALVNCESPQLGVEVVESENFLLCRQKNSAASRKQILPIIKQALMK